MSIRDRYQQDETLKKRRRSLRLLGTKVEYVLWQELRKQKFGWKFRRQVSIGKFIVDFYCHELHLIIELDGPIHAYQKEYDKKREAWLVTQGYTVLRFLNDEALFVRESVLEIILKTCTRIAAENKK